MSDTFTLADLTASEQPFRAVAAPATPTPPVVPETPDAESPPAEVPEGDVVVAADSTPADVADEPAPEAPRGTARERIEELVAERNALKKFIDYREAVWSKPAGKVETPAPTVELNSAPTLESCQFDTDKWTQAMNVWTQKQIQTGVKEALSVEKQTATAEVRMASFVSRADAFEKTAPDYKVIVGNPVMAPFFSNQMAATAELIVESEIGPKILYHLGKNPAKAAHIARQSPTQQAAAIGRLEAELKLPPKPQKQLSNAPSPPTPTGGAGGAPVSTADPKMDLAEFMKREKQALIDRRRRH